MKRNKTIQNKKIEEIYSEKMFIPPSNSTKYGSAHSDLKAKSNNEDHLKALIFQIEAEWENKNISGSLREVYRQFIQSLPYRKAIVFITKEINDLRSYNSISQICLKGIYAREESLQSIKEMNEYLSKATDWTDIIDIKLECAEILHAHRMLTLNVVESIERWKDYFMFELNDFKANFCYNGENYLEKVRNDLDFLKYSELSKVFKFSPESDPFLIFPSKIIEKKKGRMGNSNYFMHNGKVIIPLPSIIVKRVQRMENFIKNGERITSKSSQKTIRETRSISPGFGNRLTIKENATKNSEIIAKSILENIYREEISLEIEFVVNSQINEVISKQISINLDTILEPILKNIAENAIAEALSLNYIKRESNESDNDVGSIEQKFKFSLDEKKLEEEKRDNEKLRFENQQPKSIKNEEESEILKRESQEKIEKNLGTSPPRLKEKGRLKNSATNESSEKPKVRSKEEIEEEERRLKLIEASSKNARKLQDLQIYENLVRNLIEEVIHECDFDSLVDDLLKESLISQQKFARPAEKRRLTQVLERVDEEKLQNLIFHSLIEDFIKEDWLQILVSSLLVSSAKFEKKMTLLPQIEKNSSLKIEQAEEYVLEVFTPGVHSPNEIQSPEDSFAESIDKVSMTSESVNKIMGENTQNSGLSLQPINEISKNIAKVIQNYLEKIQNTEFVCSLSCEDIIKSAAQGEDSNFYWLKNASDIVGCLIFSTFVANPAKVAVIHHISTLNFSLYPSIIKKTLELITNTGHVQGLFQYKSSPSKEIIAAVKEFSPKLTQPLNQNDHSIIWQVTLNSKITSANSEFYQCKIFSQVSISTVPEPIPINNSIKAQMSHFGNRLCLLSSILVCFSVKDFENIVLPNMPSIRLQRDILELLEIITSMDNFDFPLIHHENNLTKLDVALKWLGTSYFPYEINSTPYKFIRHTSVKSLQSEENCILYIIPTEDPKIQAFYLIYSNLYKELNEEIKRSKTDLFHKVDNILKSFSGDEKIEEEIVVPAFTKEIEWDVNWMHGFEIPRQTDDQPHKYVYSCNEKIGIKMDFPPQAGGLLKFHTKKVVKDDFIFGIKHEDIDNSVDLPVFVCLVQQNDWIRC